MATTKTTIQRVCGPKRKLSKAQRNRETRGAYRARLDCARRTLRGLGANAILSALGSNPKLAKSDKASAYHSVLVHLMPADSSGFINTCKFASKGCRKVCLHTAGNRAYMTGKTRARMARTAMFAYHPELFRFLLAHEIELFAKRCKLAGKKPAVRLNGTSDIPYEKIAPELFERFPMVQFYDYTKVYTRFDKPLPDNYYLAYSLDERSASKTRAYDMLAKRTASVAIVFSGYGISAHPKPFPATHNGFPIVNADAHDLIFVHPRGSVLALRAKGDAIGDGSGFVQIVVGPLATSLGANSETAAIVRGKGMAAHRARGDNLRAYNARRGLSSHAAQTMARFAL